MKFSRLIVCGMLFAAGCHRTPQTAAELAKALPGTFTGELHLPGETEARHVSIEARELSVRSEHVLEFNRVDYQMLDAQGAESAHGEARIRGTITAPGLAIHLEMVGSEGGEEAIRPDTFAGTLSPNLQSLAAEWSTSLGQKMKLTLQAAPP